MVASIATIKDTIDRQPSIILICLVALHCPEMLSLDLVSIVPSAGICKNRGSPLSGLVGVDTVGSPLSGLVGVDTVGVPLSRLVGVDTVGAPLSRLVGVDTVGAPLSRLVCVDMVDFEGAVTFAFNSKLSLGVPINFFCEHLPLLIFGAADPTRDKGPD